MRARGIIAVTLLAAVVSINADAEHTNPIAIAAITKRDNAELARTTPSPLTSNTGSAPLPKLDEPALRVLLSSVEMTVNLLDAYGHCRDEGMQHEACITIIRTTLGHARNMIDDKPNSPPSAR